MPLTFSESDQNFSIAIQRLQRLIAWDKLPKIKIFAHEMSGRESRVRRHQTSSLKPLSVSLFSHL